MSTTTKRTLYEHEPPPYEPEDASETHKAERRKRTRQPGIRGRIAAVNEWLAVHITLMVSTMYCAYAFIVLALSGFPGFGASVTQLVQWFSQTFLQLVFLPVIAVGTAVLSRQGEHLAKAMYRGIMRLLHELLQVTKHLTAQDDVIVHLEDRIERLEEVNARQLALLETLTGHRADTPPLPATVERRPERDPKTGRYVKAGTPT